MTLPLSQTQIQYAQQIVSAGRARGMTDRDILTALDVALTESSLRNLSNQNVPASQFIPNDGSGSDGMSVGLFQQQVGIWGDAPTLMDPVQSANLFFDSLSKIGERDSMTVPQAAQTVQRSAFSDGSNYAAQLPLAQDLFNAVSGTPANASLVGNAASGGVTMFAWLLNSDNWKRIGLFALGAFLLILAFWKFLVSSGAVASATKLVAKVL